MPSIIFVTGVAGFIGSVRVRRLIAELGEPWRPGRAARSAHLGNA